ncbi:MAG: hypothetical protein EOO62_22160, partial [Hymenobacter sp.]
MAGHVVEGLAGLGGPGCFAVINLLVVKLRVANPTASEEELIRMDALCNTIVFTSQGVPFLPIGDDFLRTKKG